MERGAFKVRNREQATRKGILGPKQSRYPHVNSKQQTTTRKSSLSISYNSLWQRSSNFIPRQVSKSVTSIRTRRTTLTCPCIMSFLKYVNKCHKSSLLSYFSDPCIVNQTLTTTVIKFSENYSFTYSSWRMLRLASKSDGSSSKWLRLRSL